MKKNVPKRWGKKRNYNCTIGSSNSWRTLPRSIEPDDVKRLIRKRFTPRDKCMILVLLRTGMCICELLVLKLQDINLKERTVIIHESAKAGKGRVVYISDDAYKALRKWIKVRNPILPKPLPKFLKEQEIKIFFDHIADKRDIAMFMLMLRCGLRVGEVANLTFHAIDFERKSILVLNGKYRKDRIVYMSHDYYATRRT